MERQVEKDCAEPNKFSSSNYRWLKTTFKAHTLLHISFKNSPKHTGKLIAHEDADVTITRGYPKVTEIGLRSSGRVGETVVPESVCEIVSLWVHWFAWLWNVVSCWRNRPRKLSKTFVKPLINSVRSLECYRVQFRELYMKIWTWERLQPNLFLAFS